MELVELGYLDRLLLSQDICIDKFYTVFGGNGYAFLVSQFVPMLREAGLSEEQVRVLLVENPRRMLTGESV